MKKLGGGTISSSLINYLDLQTQLLILFKSYQSMHNCCWFVSYSITFLYSTLQKSPLDYYCILKLQKLQREEIVQLGYSLTVSKSGGPGSQAATRNDATNKLLTEEYIQNLLECIINQNRQIAHLVISWF